MRARVKPFSVFCCDIYADVGEVELHQKQKCMSWICKLMGFLTPCNLKLNSRQKRLSNSTKCKFTAKYSIRLTSFLVLHQRKNTRDYQPLYRKILPLDPNSHHVILAYPSRIFDNLACLLTAVKVLNDGKWILIKSLSNFNWVSWFPFFCDTSHILQR